MNNDNQEKSKIAKRNEAIDKFLDEMEDKNNLKKISKDEEESEDPFLKVEKEYLQKYRNDQSKEDKQFAKLNKNDKSNNIRYNHNSKNENEKSNKNNEKIKEKKLYEDFVFNHFKREDNPKNAKFFGKYFNPIIRKNPARIYMKSLQSMELNNLKMKSYNRRTGEYNSNDNNIKYKTYYNFYPKMKKDYSNFSSLDKLKNTENSFFSSSHNYRLRVLNYIDYLDYNNKKNKKVLSSNVNKKKLIFNNKKEDHFFYTSLSIKKRKTESKKKAEEEKKNKKEMNIELNPTLDSRIISKSNIGYFSENRKNNFNKTKENFMFQTKKYIRDKASINDILYSMNDPRNPYSINFSTFVLKKYYNLDFHFKKFELGVPLLRIKKFNISNAKSSYFPKNNYKMSKTSYDNFYSSHKKYLTHQNMKIANRNFNFKANHSDKNIYKEKKRNIKG